MRLTCEQWLSEPPPGVFDVCIIGSGAAGLCLAQALAPTGARIVVLEAGRSFDDAESQSCYLTEQPELPVKGAEAGRFRVPGGSTTRWGGQALPFDPIDFAARDWVPESGWPLPYPTVAAYYPAAARFMGLDGTDYEDAPTALLGAHPAAFDPALVRHQFSKFCRQPDLRQIYLPILEKSANTWFITGANVTDLHLDARGDRLATAHIASYGGAAGEVQARTFVLCCGSIENARLLLLANHRYAEGLGNASGWVGRCFQDHPGRTNATIRTSDPDVLQELFNIHYRGGTRYKPRFSMTESLQREKRILNASGVLLFDVGPDSAFAQLKETAQGLKQGRFPQPRWESLAAGFRDLGPLGKYVWSRVARGRHYNPGATLRLAISSEQEPDPESRITLSTQARDRFDLPRARLQWRLTARPARAIWEFSHVVAAEFERLGLGRVEFDPWFTEDFVSWKDTLLDNNHHMGTTRMSADEAQGVVDPDCRVHTVANLYLGGSSTFTTGGHSNPTLTILALALRLADHLKGELGVPRRS